jgi:hypothetical protein
MNPTKTQPKLAVLCAFVLLSALSRADGQTLFSFPFDEGGTNTTFTDTAQGITGTFGAVVLDPVNDTVALTSDSPSGQPGDGSFSNLGKGFLIANDSASKVLNITNGPITMEAWVKKNGSFAATTEGVVSYGSSYKMGFRTSGIMVFTLLSKVDITSTMNKQLPFDEWVHIASVWQPGVGVTFYVSSNSLFAATNKFVANTNATAVPTAHNLLSIGNEGFANPLVGSFDRVRIHQAVLTQAELDEDPLVPKPLYASTKVAYDFNEISLPTTNSAGPALPANNAVQLLPLLTGPTWTNGVTTNANDFALYFNGAQRGIFLDSSGSPQITLGGDTSGTNGDYTVQAWVKLPLGFEPAVRMVMFTYQANPAFSFSINTGRRLHTTTLGKNDIVSGAQVPNDNQWHHVAAVHVNGVEERFYIDGILLSRMPYIRGPGLQTTFQLTVGGASGLTANPFVGSLDRISLSRGALTPSQFDIPGFVPPPVVAGDISRGLVLRLRLDETNGFTASDSTGGNHPGSLINFTNTDNSQWLAGRIAGSLRFVTNATPNPITNSPRVNVPDPSGVFNFATNGTTRTNSTFTVAAWIYGNGNFPQIQGAGVVAHGFGPEQFALDMLSGNNLRFVIRDTVGTAIEVLTLANNNVLHVTNRWIHMVGVFDGEHQTNGLRIYIDGLLANANDCPRAVWNKNYDVTVGAREFNNTSGYTQVFQGLIDDVRLYDRALTPADVLTLFQDADVARLNLLANGASGTLAWPITVTNYVPQVASSLLTGNAGWTDLAGSLTTNGYHVTLPVSLTATNAFFRLRSAP